MRRGVRTACLADASLPPRAMALGVLLAGVVGLRRAPGTGLIVAAGAMSLPWIVAAAETRWGRGHPTRRQPLDDAGAAPAVLIVAAHLPNEAEIIIDSVRRLLADVDYPGSWRVIVAYNTDRLVPVERELIELAASEPRLSMMHVSGSTTKAENLNAALATTDEPLIGILDADARPEPCALRLAANWIEAGWDFVQGANLVSADHSRLARAVAAEFAAKYLTTYAGRFAGMDIAYFSGSNGYWAGDAARSLRFDPRADVEDIDCAVRALLEGRHLAFDPDIRCWESAPASWPGLWRQRLRWASGWVQLTTRYVGPLARTRALSPAQRAFWLHATGWRRGVTPAAALVVALTTGIEARRGRLARSSAVVATATLVCWLSGLAQAVATTRGSDAPKGLPHPVSYAVMYVLAEGARLWASSLVLVRRPPWTPTPRPQGRTKR